MIFRIFINIVLAINIFLYGMDNPIYFNKVAYQIVMLLICISLSVYMIYSIKLKEEKILFGNILYLLVVSYIYPPTIMLLFSMIIEYIQVKEYSLFYVVVSGSIYTFISLRIGVGYTNIFLGITASTLIYDSINSYRHKEGLRKYNYDLKEKVYALEERRILDNKISYQNIESVKVEERNIISQKLHDKIGHTLAGSIMQLEALKIVMKSDKEKGDIILESIIDNLRNGMDDIRATLRRIKPEQSQISVNNLKKELEEFSKKSNIETELSLEGDLSEINLVYWRGLMECVNEILTNSIKYSNGNIMNIEVSVLNKIIRLHIKDNGSYQGKIKKGMGLLGIEERIVNLGGDVYFNNDDGFSSLIILKR